MAGLVQRSVVDHEAPQSEGPLTDYAATFQRDALRRRMESLGADIVHCINADQAQADALRARRAFHVIRDPRDIIVSAYFSHRNSHPTDGMAHMQRHREQLLGASKHDGLLLEMEYSRHELEQIGAWRYDQPAVLELKMEDLIARPYEGFLEIAAHLGLLQERPPTMGAIALATAQQLNNRLALSRRILGRIRRPSGISPEWLLASVYTNRFERQTAGRRPGVEDVMSHYRKGVAGDWANHFTDAHKAAFEDRFGDLLVRLGYEANSDWATPQALRI